jgi:hypothetical protein
MWIAGHPYKQAYRLVAETLTESGRRGKGGNPVSWRSVQQWYIATDKPLENNVGKRLGPWWQVAPCPHGQLATNCQTGQWNDSRCSQSKEIALAMAKSIWQLPQLRDWFHPMVSD